MATKSFPKVNLDELPESTDSFWEEAEKYKSSPVPLQICDTHTKDNWMEHHGYIDNHDSTVSCKFCPWGTILPGYMRLINGKVIDLSKL